MQPKYKKYKMPNTWEKVINPPIFTSQREILPFFFFYNVPIYAFFTMGIPISMVALTNVAIKT